MAEIHSTIESLELGYETMVGESGGRLSGGQQQRIAVARALIRNPDLLLLDEATSALDATTELALIETLQRVTEGRSVIAVTHRLALAVAMERIIVLDQGHIVEDGSHEELLTQDGPYSRLWNKQAIAPTQPDGTLEIDLDHLLNLPPLKPLRLADHRDQSALEELRDRFVRESYRADMPIIRQGEAPDGFRIIARGRVEVVREGTEGEERLAVLEEGDNFGEGALLSGSTRMATVRALVSTLCLTLSGSDFLAVLERSPGLRAKLDELFQQRLDPLLQHPSTM